MCWLSGTTWNGPECQTNMLYLSKLNCNDNIEWVFILSMLEALNFGPQFIRSVRMLFQDALAMLSSIIFRLK